MRYGHLLIFRYMCAGRSTAFAAFGIVLSVLCLWFLEPVPDSVEIAMHCAVNVVRLSAGPFIWSGGVDRMGPVWGPDSVERVGAPRERPGHRYGDWAFPVCA
jgi:hypothetical protein